MFRIPRLFVLWLATVCLLGITFSSARAEPPTLMTWNIAGAELSPAAVAARVEQALDSVGPVEVLVLQEVVAEDQVQAAADAGGFAYWAMSDFSPPVAITGAWHKSLEVAILSRRPISAAAEWDTTGRRPEGDGHPPSISTPGAPTRELRLEIETGDDPPARGFLRADLEGDWSLYAVHWKSSRGTGCSAADREHARLREVQAAGLAADAASLLSAGRSLIIAGDLNIQAPGRVARVGTDPGVDCAPSDGRCDGLCGAGAVDGYDDSIAILLEIDPSARLLSGVLDSTYLGRRFPGGAIDHILVAGPKAGDFTAARTPALVAGKRWHGSDHRPVIAETAATAGALRSR